MQATLADKTQKIRNRWFILIIIIFSFILYGNTVFNWYSLDDYHVTPVPYQETKHNMIIAKGIEGIPEIFTTLYAEESGRSYGYRPIVRASFAIDNELFGHMEELPYISHLINVLLYMFSILALFVVLKKLFKRFHPFFPFLVTLLFMAHPMHTEVVASLKNRDEILNLLFSLLALNQFIHWANRDKVKYLLFGILFYILALLSKTTALAFLLIFPLALYFFTEIKTKRLLWFSSAVFLLALMAAVIPLLLLGFSRPVEFMENPLVEEGFFNRVATGLYILLIYLKKLIYPWPMAYYYGYDTIAVQTFASGWVIFSLLLHLGLFVFAIKKFKEKHILSFTVLYYLITIAMFTNIVMPVPGIIGDRFLYLPSLAFAIALAWFIFKLFKTKLAPEEKTTTGFPLKPVALVILILIPYTVLTIDRNKDWRTEYDLYLHDVQYLDRSVKAHDMLATNIMSQINRLIASERINVTKMQMPQIKKAKKHWEKALEIYPGHYSSWYNLGFIHTEYLKNYDTAVNYFHRALRLCPSDSLKQCILANYYLGKTYERVEKYDSAFYYLNESHRLNPADIRSIAAATDIYYMIEEYETANRLNERMKRAYPNSPIPWINEGRYYLVLGEEKKARQYLQKAMQVGGYQSMNRMMFEYFRNKRDWKSASKFYINTQQETQQFNPSLNE
ncbi:MAG: hypothetical protein K9G67_06515 [Bacteroidales bacterium]|nr:hypothetical protein [Bacteroidales bacterium]MCF8343019.1 hypothetical protein [Bacteroidales bacterium]MCF8350259.1 hypothetical protein [Bacteroidales bacterium]MCF8375991.1 hypothetical protein [Bacteroidales bacterium]